MIDIKVKKKGEGRNASTAFSWIYENKEVTISFSVIARHVYVEDNESVFFSLYSEDEILRYSLSGELIESFNIPEKRGYQYRGINRNLKAKLGVSLLFCPVDDDVGNQWRDIEQYELESESQPLGKYINIYR
ncbi:hypothetical protein [Agaribacterium sp. ZY112]|uniref:hypothetical protein n=1 Tax=Agaribacterium sp. ZY112 TaxID=3233574 RepID=UPI003524A85A